MCGDLDNEHTFTPVNVTMCGDLDYEHNTTLGQLKECHNMW